MKILVINAGSSSLKYQLLDVEKQELLAKGLCERIGLDQPKLKHKATGKEEYVVQPEMKNHSDAVRLVLEALTSPEHGIISSMKEIDAVGHRGVNCGDRYANSVLVTDEVKQTMRDCFDLAPLHNPANLIGIEACEVAMPGVPMVVAFDTSFHTSMPAEAYMYALPYEYYEKYGVRRYGAHGTSHRFVAERTAEILGKPFEELKIITCHLGNGSSLAAVKNGKCYDTSMGMTPLAGVCMGTRTGDFDPAIIPFLMQKEGMSAADIDSMVNKKSGVAGVSGVSSDFRDLEDAAKAGNERAALAREMFAYHCVRYIGSYFAVIGGCDALVFTAGIGENDTGIRESIVSRLGGLGITMDTALNSKIRGKECDISGADSKVRVLVVPTNEELMIARDTARIVGMKA